MSPEMQRLREDATLALTDIHDHFTPDSKILVVVVFPHKPDQNWMLGNATIDEAIEGLQWLQRHGEDIQ